MANTTFVAGSSSSSSRISSRPLCSSSSTLSTGRSGSTRPSVILEKKGIPPDASPRNNPRDSLNHFRKEFGGAFARLHKAFFFRTRVDPACELLPSRMAGPLPWRCFCSGRCGRLRRRRLQTCVWTCVQTALHRLYVDSALALYRLYNYLYIRLYIGSKLAANRL